MITFFCFCNTGHPPKYYPALYYTRATEDIEQQYINDKAANEEEKLELVKQFNGKYGNRTYYLVTYSQSKNILLYMDGQIEIPSVLYHAQLSAYRNIYLFYGQNWKTSFLAGSVYISTIETAGTPRYDYFDLADNKVGNPFASPTKAFGLEERSCINYRILRPAIKVAEVVALPTRSIVFILEGGLVDYVTYSKNEAGFDTQKASLAKDIAFSVAQHWGHTLLRTNWELAGKYPEYFSMPFNDKNFINIETARISGSKVIAVKERLGKFSMTPSVLHALKTTINLIDELGSCYCKNSSMYDVRNDVSSETMLMSSSGVIAYTGAPEKYEVVFPSFIRALSITFTHSNFAKAMRGMRLRVQDHDIYIYIYIYMYIYIYIYIIYIYTYVYI